MRDQVRWLALGAATSVAMTIAATVLPLPAGLDAPLIILPITTAITIALIRHRLVRDRSAGSSLCGLCRRSW